MQGRRFTTSYFYQVIEYQYFQEHSDLSKHVLLILQECGEAAIGELKTLFEITK